MGAIPSGFSVSTGSLPKTSRPKDQPVSGRTIAQKETLSYSAVQKSTVRFELNVRTDTQQTIGDQNALFHFNRLGREEKDQLTYNGSPISELSQAEARDLVSDTGYFGVAKTSGRIADFVINGAGDDLDRLKTGREGMLKGFSDAEKAWGGRLPDISYQTMEKALEAVDEQIRNLGGSVVDLST